MSAFHLEVLVSGVLMGFVYALVAMGLTIIFGVMRLVNFAHGEMVVAGMYIGYISFERFALGTAPAAAIAGGVAFLLGWLVQRLVVMPFVHRPQHIQFLLFIAIAFVLTGIHVLVFGTEPRSILSSASFASYTLGPLRLDAARLHAAAGALVMMAGLFIALRLTPLGRRIRAAADNPLGARVVGIRIPQVYAATAGLGMACAAVAGALLAPLFSIHPYMAPEFTLLAFTVIIVGGVGSLAGAFSGGLLIGLSEAVAALLVSPSAKGMFAYALLVLVLLLRPAGLFGVREAEA